VNSISEILKATNHRPWEMPAGKWKFYQEWNNALFIHWEISIDILKNYVPQSLTIDTFDGKAYISLVAFTMEKIRPRYLPSLSFISDFHEINIRTYISNGNKKGVYFLNIEAEKLLSAIIAKNISGLPYEKSVMTRTKNTFESINFDKDLLLKTDFDVNELLPTKTELDKWLTERYCLYLEEKKSVYRYEIHHKEWEIKKVSINNLELNYNIGEIHLSAQKHCLSHYSEGVKVLAWNRNEIEI